MINMVSTSLQTTMIMSESVTGRVGDVVRWGPNELSFACADAWRDIYDRRKDGKVLVKDPLFYRTDNTYVYVLRSLGKFNSPPLGTNENDSIRAKHIVNTHDPELHAQMRKMMVKSQVTSSYSSFSSCAC